MLASILRGANRDNGRRMQKRKRPRHGAVATACLQTLEARRMLAADPGNTFDTAFNLGDLVGEQTFSDTVSSTDSTDIYRFTMPMAGHFFGRLRAYNATTEIGLLQQFSDSSGTHITPIEFHNATAADFNSGDFDRVLAAGTYFIEVSDVGGDTQYLTRMTADYAGETLATARDIGSAVHDTYADFVGDFGVPSLTDPVDDYKFKMDANGNCLIDLEQDNGFTDPNTFQSHFSLIHDINGNNIIDPGETVFTSAPGAAGGINIGLAAGTYHIRVFPDLNYENYHLTVGADYAFDTEAGARNLGSLSSGVFVNDFISSATDFRDTYKFSLSSQRSFFGSLGANFSGIDLLLFRDINNNGLIDNGEFVTSTVSQGANTMLADLPAGNYFMHVDAFAGGAGKYSLFVEAPPDAAGNSIGAAKNLGTLNGDFTGSFDTYVSQSDTSDFFKVTLASAGSIRSSIDPYLGANADLALIRDTNGNGVIDSGEILASSTNPSGADSINKSVSAGTYFLRVSYVGGGPVSRYFMSATTDLAGNSLSSARAMNAITTFNNVPNQQFKDYIEQNFGSGSDVEDFYRFDLADQYSVNLSTTGVSGEDLSLALIKDSNNNGVIDSGDTLATSQHVNSPSESITKTLSGGRYFVRVHGVNGATNYTLTAKFTGKDPDDTISEVTSSTNNNKSIGQSADLTMATRDDVDLIRFHVNSVGQKVGFDVDSRNGSNIDSYLRLFNSSGTRLVSNNDGAAPGESASKFSYLTYRFTQTGTYYIGVSLNPNNAYNITTGNGDVNGNTPTGAYRLTLNNLGIASASPASMPAAAMSSMSASDPFGKLTIGGDEASHSILADIL